MNVLKVGDPQRLALDLLEADIDKVQARIASVSGALRPANEVRAAIAVALNAEMGYGRHVMNGPSMALFRAPGGTHDGYARGALHQPLTALDLAAIFGEDAIVDRLTELTMANKSRPTAVKKSAVHVEMSTEQRASSLDTLGAQLKDLRAKAEREAMKLESDGHTIIRREDADVDVLLTVWASMPELA